MKVLIVRNQEASTNASIRRVLDSLVSIGYEVTILSRNRECENVVPEFVLKKVDINGTSVDNYELQLSGTTEKGLTNLSTLRSYMKYIEKWMVDNCNSFDIIHSFDLDTGIVSKKISKKYNKKLVYHIADFYVDSRAKIPKILKSIIRNLEISIIDFADATIICSEERRNQILGSKPKRLLVIHNVPSINLDIIDDKPSKELDKDKVVISYIGRLTNRRFISHIINVAAVTPRLVVNLAGTGDLTEKIIEYSKKYNNIRYHGIIPYDKTLDIYADSDLMFAIYNPDILNHKYSAANKIYEAMLLKKPIVVAKDTSMDKIVYRHDIGFVIDYDEEKFKELIDNIISNKKIIDEKSKNMEGVYELYSWENMKKRLTDLYTDLGKVCK